MGLSNELPRGPGRRSILRLLLPAFFFFFARTPGVVPPALDFLEHDLEPFRRHVAGHFRRMRPAEFISSGGGFKSPLSATSV